jgi:NADH:ubiquinone oxidoreductase subunit 5 (subunit L)/multisubunit Na+/H+ antiporter MnhA subunit
MSFFLDFKFLNFEISMLEVAAFLLLISAFIKSAQFGFHI